VRIDPCCASGLGEQQEGEKSNGFWFVGHQLNEGAGQVSCFGGEVDA
jgi:hypothetical protein